MSAVTLELPDDLVACMRSMKAPLEQSAKEMIVLELYRRGAISSGFAAGALAMGRTQFIQRASQLGIPYTELEGDELDQELARLDQR